MNATKLLAKYEILAEVAHRTGAYNCARKWSIKAEKLEAVISALETVEEQVMSTYQRLVSRFVESRNNQETADKAARFILKAAREFYNFDDEVAPKFNPTHHQFIKEIIADEQAKNEAEDRKNESNYETQKMETWESLDSYIQSPLVGSPKQVNWAQSIRGYAIEKQYAPAVAGGEMSFQDAVKAIQNSSAKYWIENRQQWGMK